MGIDSVKKYISANLIEKNVLLVDEMQRHNQTYGRIEDPWKRAIFVAGLYFKYAIFKQNPLYMKQKKMSRLYYPEFEIGQIFDKDDFIAKAQSVDAVAFDAWDICFYTSLNREQLSALAETVTLHLGMADYDDTENERSECENILLDFTIENEFIHQLWDEIKAMGKEVFIRNNSALYSNDIVLKLIRKYRFDGEIYHSQCDNVLFLTQSTVGEKNYKYINVNAIGNKYRPFHYLNSITALYNQIVNIGLHNGMKNLGLFYEYGFAYGGILACGFCQYLNRLVKEQDVDLLLFVARDGYILKEIYDRYYRQTDTSYLTFSRFASLELIFEDYPEEYIDKNIKPRMYRKNGDNRIIKILQECKLEFLRDLVEEEGLSISDNLEMTNYLSLKKVLLKYRDKIQESFKDSTEASKQYFIDSVKDYKKVCVVDLGWRGKSIVYLKHLLEKKYGWNGTVTGAVVGAANDYVTQNYVRRGVIKTYAFENEYWRRTGNQNGEYMTVEEIICIEALFTSEEDTLLRYRLDSGGKTEFIYGKKNQNRDNIKMIHRGITDFAKKFAPIINKYNLMIMPRDAYTPLDYFLQNEKNRDLIYQAYYEVPSAINGFGED